MNSDSSLEERVEALERRPPADSIGSSVYISPAGTTEAPEGPTYLAGLACGDSSLAAASANREVLQAAIEALPLGGTIWLPACDIYFDSSIDLVETHGIIWQGQSGLSAGAPTATRLIHTGLLGTPFSPWECESTFGLIFRDLQLLHTSDLSNTHLINMEHGGVREEDAAYNRIERCNLGGLGTSSAMSLVNLDQAIDCSFHNAHFGAAQVHVRGITGSGKYSNGHSFENCAFTRATLCPVIDPSEGWTFLNPTVEPLQNGSAAFISENATVPNVAKGLSIVGGWFGDANATGDWIRTSGVGIASYGSRVGTGGSWMRLGNKGPVEGLAIVGGHFDSVTNLLVVEAEHTHKDWMVAGNHYVNTGAISWAPGATMPTHSIIDNPKDQLYMPGMLLVHHGAVSDAIFPVPPPDGTFAYDNESARLWVRSGATWRKSGVFE